MDVWVYGLTSLQQRTTNHNENCSPPDSTTAYQLLHGSINRQVTNVVTKNYGNLALSPTFRCVSIESPL
ncbi:hypothetical protein TNCV_1968721 [Trichonephila clavipes]|nr:hypothetical protein TNCV_1968721 [Trichonephila clavipes]